MRLNTPKIDSLRLLIPFHRVKVNPNHTEFLRTIHTINDDGEILNSKINNTYRLHTNPCSSTYLRANTIIRGQVEDVIKIGFSSKILQELYFEGISAQNIDRIHKFITEEGVITLSKEALLEARVVDVDICMDVMLKDCTTTEAVEYLYMLSIAHKGTRVNKFVQKNNVGIEFGDRNKVGKSYIKKQYLKYYSKAMELKYNSTTFYNTYIKDQEALKPYLKDKYLFRIETTLKNKAHWDTYKLTVETLNDLLSLDLSKYLEVFERPISHYMTGEKIIQKRTHLTPNEKEKLKLIEVYMKLYDLNQEEAINTLAQEIEDTDRRHRYRYIKKLQSLVNKYREADILNANKNHKDLVTELSDLNLIPKD